MKIGERLHAAWLAEGRLYAENDVRYATTRALRYAAISTSTMSILWICSLEFRYVEAGWMTRLQRNAAPLRASPTSHDNIDAG